MITVCDDAPEENNEYAEPQTCEGDGIRLYFRAVGELAASSTRNPKNMFFEYYCLRLAPNFPLSRLILHIVSVISV